MSSTATNVGDSALRLQFRPRARILQLLGDELIGFLLGSPFSSWSRMPTTQNAESVRVTLSNIESNDRVDRS